MIDYDYIIGHLLEIIIVIATFVILFLQIRKKTLTYIVLTKSGLVPFPHEAQGNVQILHKGKVVPNVQLVEMRIKNSGNLPIKPEDYIEPLRVQLPNSKILSSEVRDAHSVGAYIETKLSNQSEIVL